MKNLSKKPGLEFAFYMGLLLLIVLPAMVFAQQDRRTTTTIIINNGDTLLNGQKLNQLNSWQKHLLQNALADTVIHQEILARNLRPMPGVKHFADSLKKQITYYYMDTNGRRKAYRTYADNQRRPYPAPDRMPTMRPNMNEYYMPTVGGPARRSSDNRGLDFGDNQDFDFNNTDKNGIRTNVSFHVSTPPPELIKRQAGVEKNSLSITDLTLVPEFSSGKTLLIFTLPANIPAEVTFADTDGNKLWSDKSGGNKFNKAFALPLNGVYYLTIKQGGKVAVKEVVKE